MTADPHAFWAATIQATAAELAAHFDTTRRPGDEVTACPACDGEGYRYTERAGRHAEHPVTELRCARCGGSGLIESRTP